MASHVRATQAWSAEHARCHFLTWATLASRLNKIVADVTWRRWQALWQVLRLHKAKHWNAGHCFLIRYQVVSGNSVNELCFSPWTIANVIIAPSSNGLLWNLTPVCSSAIVLKRYIGFKPILIYITYHSFSVIMHLVIPLIVRLNWLKHVIFA